MGLIGNEIVQSRVWIEDPPPPLPSLNYKYTFPITVFDAVRKSMQDENSETLTEVLDRIFKELARKQPIIPGRPANYLVTYAGAPGALGAIQMSYEIPWDAASQSNMKIPTEKAVGDYFRKLGLLDDNGEVIPPEDRIVRWSDIVGRPNIYNGTGLNDDGVMTQRAITEALQALEDRLTQGGDGESIINNILKSIETLKEHVNDKTNPHAVSLEQIGAASKESLDAHLHDFNNPHRVSKEQIGLENVDNTSDKDKPISDATQEALDRLLELIKQLQTEVGGGSGPGGNTDPDNPNNPSDDIGRYVKNITYNQESGALTVIYQDDSSVIIHIPINGLVDDIRYDPITKDLVIIELGAQHRVSLLDLFNVYIGSEGTNINITIEETSNLEPNVIHAVINPKSITSNLIADRAIVTDLIANAAVSSEKIRAGAITTDKLDTLAVTTGKIANYSITDKKLADRSVTPRAMFTSTEDNRILIVKKAGSDPVWGTLPASTIPEGSITNEHIVNNTITGDKIVNNSITENHIVDKSITKTKIANNSIVNEHITNNTITGEKVVRDVILQGTPELTENPRDDADNNQLTSTSWVRNFVSNYEFNTNNFGDRSVTGDKLFSTGERNRALVVYSPYSNPVWGQINHDMVADNAIDTSNIYDHAITRDKIFPRAISDKEIDDYAIKHRHVSEDAIEGENIWRSPVGHRVLAVIGELEHPVYTQVDRLMIQYGAIGTEQIEERSITLSKLEQSQQSNRVLATTLKNSTPAWTQVTNPMLASRSVDTRVLDTSEVGMTVLAVQKAGDDPLYTKIRSDMIFPGEVKEANIGDGAIAHRHLQDKIVDSSNIMDWAITSNNIAPHAITGIELFTSAIPNRVLAVAAAPYSNAAWLQVNTDMIEDCAVSRDKIFRSNYDYRVLGVTEHGKPPEYLRITGNFIVNDSINAEKLVENIVLRGTPRLTTDPDPRSDGFEIASTHWVHNLLLEMKNNGELGGGGALNGSQFWKPENGVGVLGINEEGNKLDYIMIDYRVIANGGITYGKLARDLLLLGSPRLDIRPPDDACDANGNGDLIPDCQWVLDRLAELEGPAVWDEISHIRVEDEWANNGVGSTLTEDNYEITKDRVNREWEDKGQGDLTPDNQYEIEYERVEFEWNDGASGEIEIPQDEKYEPPGFLDPWEIELIESGKYFGGTFGNGEWAAGGGGEAGGNTPGTVPGSLTKNSVATEHIRRRAVTGEKLFTSAVGKQILAVIEPNGDPQWITLDGDLIKSRSITGRHLFTAEENNVVLAVRAMGSSPEWVHLNSDMLEDGMVTNRKIHDLAVTTEKIADQAIDITKLKREPMIDAYMLLEGAVTTDKIANGAISAEKLGPDVFNSETISEDLNLKGTPTVSEKSSNSYEVKAIRNIIISNNLPSSHRVDGGCKNGDIWFQFM